MGDSESSVSEQLSESERVQVSVMLEKLDTLHSQADSVKRATSDLIASIVILRGLDPKEYGVNIQQGKVLLL